MKYIICAAILLGIIAVKPWRLCCDTPNTPPTEELSAGERLIPIHDFISNDYSDLKETKQLDKTIERFMKKWEINGASLAIMKDNKLIYSKGYGFADIESETPTGVNHIFRIASISKLITAVGIMKLSENNRLSLDDKVFGREGILNDSIFLDIADKRLTQITVEHLLRHQGGFSVRYTDPMFNPVEVAEHMNVPPPADLNTIIRYVLGKRLGFSPGTSTNYSNVGYGILSKVIEKTTGLPYETYIRDSILIPSGCYDMHLGNNRCKDHFPNEVNYYEPSTAEKICSCYGDDELVFRCDGGNNIEGLYGAGGWVASPTELLRFLLAIDGDPEYPDILCKESIDSMTRYQPSGLPIGWMNTSEGGDWRRSGTLAGSSAMMKRQKNGFSWVFLTNTSSWVGSRFPRKIELMMHEALNRVKNWPERDLFDPEYCLELKSVLDDLALEHPVVYPNDFI